MDEYHYWVGFNLVKGIGSLRFRALLDYFGSAKAAWSGSPADLAAAGLGAKVVKQVVELRSRFDLSPYLEQILSQGITLLTWDHPDFPLHLKEIDQPPPVLYIRGNVTAEDHWAVAIVGTRNVIAYGRQVSETLAVALAQSGVTVVSGLACGVDAIAHAAALKAGGRTLAVLGSGVDKIYPPDIPKWR